MLASLSPAMAAVRDADDAEELTPTLPVSFNAWRHTAPKSPCAAPLSPLACAEHASLGRAQKSILAAKAAKEKELEDGKKKNKGKAK